ncbi:hypothetical protein GH714_036752 [Hevea brasiliensis]|uniref:Uncharacterized protein n=1 Tax=Hevea brasiliensis TaxID=3981 RepID=A0A6A6NF15_HEVBR|nr:hypothetical protein GH714_036752 [Hevea brasiliensis]
MARDTASICQGWEIPTNGKKIEIENRSTSEGMLNSTYECDKIAWPSPVVLLYHLMFVEAILKVAENKIKKIEGKWFGQLGTCPDRSNSYPSNRLGLNSFWGLFLIAGIASLMALTIYTGMVIYQNRGVSMPSNSRVSIWRRILQPKGLQIPYFQEKHSRLWKWR